MATIASRTPRARSRRMKIGPRNRKVVCTAMGVTAALFAMGAGPAVPKFDGGRAYEDLRQVVMFGPRPAGSPALDSTRQVHQEAARRIRHPGRRTAVRRRHARRAASHGEPHRASPRRVARPPRFRRPLRHEAVPRVPLRRRQRRRVEHGVSDRVGTRHEGAQESAHHRAGLPRRRGGHVAGVGRCAQRPHLRQPALCRDRAEG